MIVLHPCHHSTDNAESSSVRSDGEQAALGAQIHSDAADVPGRPPMAVQSVTVTALPAAPALITSESGSAPATASLFSSSIGSALVSGSSSAPSRSSLRSHFVGQPLHHVQ